MFFIKKRDKTEKSTFQDLQRLCEIVETGFYYDSKPLDRLAAASALGSMKTILRIINEPYSFTGTQAEDLEKLINSGKVK